MTRAEADADAVKALTAAAAKLEDMLDSLATYGDIDDIDAEDDLRTAIKAMENAAGRLLLRVGMESAT